MRRYVVLVARPRDRGSASTRQASVAAHHAFDEYVDAYGRRIGSAALAGPDTATTIRHVDGVAAVSDGPFVSSSEEIGGYYDIELPDLDAAIAAGRLLPPTYAVEIRPVATLEGHESG